MNKLNLIKITGDFLRPNLFGSELHQKSNVDWLFSILNPALTGCGVRVDKVFPSFSDICTLYNSESIPFLVESWAYFYDKELSGHIKEYVINLLACDLLIVYELPPCMEKILKEFNINYISFSLHPIRFCGDFYFSVAASSNRISDVLKKTCTHESRFVLEANAIKHQVKSKIRRKSILPDGAVLICGQTYGDRVLIKDGKFIDFCDFYEEIVSLSSKNKLFFKLHPMMQFPEKHISFFSNVPYCRIINDNFYELISLTNDMKVISISSGTSIEARVFGIDSDFLYESPYNLFCQQKEDFFGKRNDKVQESYSLDSKVLSFEFWNWVINEIKPDFFPFFGNDFIKKTLGFDWGISSLTNKLK